LENSVEQRSSSEIAQPRRGHSFFDDAPESVLLSPKPQDDGD